MADTLTNAARDHGHVRRGGDEKSDETTVVTMRPIHSDEGAARGLRAYRGPMSEMVLWGFDGSTYVRTIKMLLAEKSFTAFKQEPLNVLAGDPKKPDHLARHPFGKVPVLDYQGHRILETTAIARYLNDVLPGPSLVPGTPEDRARMDEVIGLIDSYGYGALVGVAAYHLFPDFVGGKNEAMREGGIATSRKVLDRAMHLRGSSTFIAGDAPSLADLYLAPLAFYISLTPDKDAVFAVKGFAEWWAVIQKLPSYTSTIPNLG